MPHINLEYTRNITNFDAQGILSALNQVCLDTGLFGEADIKSRAVGLDDFQVGVKPGLRAFVHVRIALLSGRGSEQKKGLSNGVLAMLMDRVKVGEGMEIQFSVEVVDMDRGCYAKESRHG